MSQQKETPTKLDNFENVRVVKSEEDGAGGLSECEASKKESESTTTRLEVRLFIKISLCLVLISTLSNKNEH